MLYLQLLAAASDAEVKSTEQTIFSALFLFGALFFIFLFSAWFIRWHAKFKRELRHINQRIQQSINERERMHYIRRRRHLYLSILPFVKYKYR